MFIIHWMDCITLIASCDQLTSAQIHAYGGHFVKNQTVLQRCTEPFTCSSMISLTIICQFWKTRGEREKISVNYNSVSECS